MRRLVAAFAPFGIAVYYLLNDAYVTSAVFALAGVVLLLLPLPQRRTPEPAASAKEVALTLEPDQKDEIRALVRTGKKIRVIREARDLTGTNLRSAEAYIDFLKQG